MLRPDLVIAIDGPAGAGKSTVARIVAEQLGLALLDTGAMYRAIAWFATRQGFSSADVSQIVGLLRQIEIDLTSDSPNRVFVNGEEVTAEIRTLEIGQAASEISTISEVRRFLVQKQQQIISRGGRVLEGRDVTTVVAPDADLKIFLTASIEERARRRWLEYQERGEQTPLTQVVKDVVIRDHRDYTRDDSPLMLAEDAVIVESFGVTPEEVADRIVALARAL